jgi:hypothetical protein
MKFWLSVLFSLNILCAGYNVGDRFTVTELSDQYDQKVSIVNAKKVMVAFDKASYYDIDQFLASKPNFLNTNSIAFINDVSAVPSTILNLFIKPSLQKRKYTILLLRDLEVSKGLDFSQGKITIYTLKKQKITKIEQVDSRVIGSYFR